MFFFCRFVFGAPGHCVGTLCLGGLGARVGELPGAFVLCAVFLRARILLECPFFSPPLQSLLFRLAPCGGTNTLARFRCGRVCRLCRWSCRCAVRGLLCCHWRRGHVRLGCVSPRLSWNGTNAPLHRFFFSLAKWKIDQGMTATPKTKT